MFKIFLILLSLIQSSSTEELPQGLTQDELENIDMIHSMGSRTEPPVGPVMNMILCKAFLFDILSEYLHQLSEKWQKM